MKPDRTSFTLLLAHGHALAITDGGNMARFKIPYEYMLPKLNVLQK
jgi:hypothetical protein